VTVDRKARSAPRSEPQASEGPDRKARSAPRSEPQASEGPVRAVFWLGPIAALLGAAVALFHDGENGLRAIFHLEDELAAADQRLDRLREERAGLLLRAERLRSDPLEIESAARESLGMVRPGEIVVRLPAEPSRGD
jgi:cell division protein FtsB